MKKHNIWRIVWMVGIYAILLLILFLVVQYKVKWEGIDLSDYLYFYNCSNNLCTTNEKIITYYSRVKCDNNKCPYIKDKKDNLVILTSEKKEYIYDYIRRFLNYSFFYLY